MSQSAGQSAYFVVYHGSRDPRPAALAEQLASQMATCLQQRSPNALSSELASSDEDAPLLAIAPLECCETPLQSRLAQFAHEARQQGYSQVQIIPLFLMAGVHVREDIPAEVEAAQEIVGDRQQLSLCPYLGSHPRLADYLRSLFSAAPSSSLNVDQTVHRVLISHGSRRSGGNRAIEAIAQEIQAQPAYWSVEPKIETCLMPILQDKTSSDSQPSRVMEILPYFLFAGGITDAIGQAIAEFQRRFPSVQFRLAKPLGANRAIAQMAVDLTASPAVQAPFSPYPQSSDSSSFMTAVG